MEEDSERKWRSERKRLLHTIAQQKEHAKRLAKRFALLQTTLQEQQQVLDRYHRALDKTGYFNGNQATEPKTKDKKTTALLHESTSTPHYLASSRKRQRQEPILHQLPESQHASSSIDLLVTPFEEECGDKTIKRKEELVMEKKEKESKPATQSLNVGLPDGNWIAKKEAILIQPATITASPTTTTITTATVTPATRPDKLAKTWHEEKQKLPPFKRPLRAPGASLSQEDDERPRASNNRKNDKENQFRYVEVVRNRADRAALPGHDCVECRKYYDALGEAMPDDHRDACSRHRARFEPYCTPDDFWRLSFPDSHAS